MSRLEPRAWRASVTSWTSLTLQGRPDKTTILSPSSTASSTECVTSRQVVSVADRILSSSRFSSERVISSSAPKGSSSRRRSGLVASARARETLWRIPPDSSRDACRPSPKVARSRAVR